MKRFCLGKGNFTTYFKMLTVDAGWFSGNPFVLFQVVVAACDGRYCRVLEVQIAKFCVGVSVEW